MRTWLRWLAVVAIVGGGAAFGLQCGRAQTAVARPSLETAAVRRGDLVLTINSTGTVEPEDLIDVGAQVAGRIVEFGTDKGGRTVDYGSEVEEGMVLARIDDEVYRSELALAEAQLAGSQADLDSSKVSLKQMESKLAQANRDWTRAQKLGPSEALSQSSYDNYRLAADVAEANVELGKVAIRQAEAKLAQAQATLDRARKNLGYCIIQSPVNGTIIDRRVNAGQTVVASLSAPSLFLIAKDLRRVQIWVSVNEADIGSVRAGQPVTFTVDAFPDETFHGQVSKVRLNATMTNNVVTYTVEVTTDNSNGRLLPYLTASVDFEVARSEGVLLVPNGALKWTPTDEVRKAFGAGEAPSGEAPAAAKQGTLWVADGDELRQVAVTLGISDGTDTEVSGAGLEAGALVVTDVQEASAQGTAATPAATQKAGTPAASGQTGAASSATTNPFMPKPPTQKKGQGPPPM